MITFITIWLVFAVITHGVSFAYYQRKWPDLSVNDYRRDIVKCLKLAIIGGPLSFIGFCMAARRESFKYGFKLW